MRGGARPGAGRKSLAPEEKKVTVSMRVNPAYKEWLQAQAEFQGESLGRILEILIDSFCDTKEDGE